MSNFRSVKEIIQKKLYITEHHKNDEDDFEDFLSMGTIFQESEKEGNKNHTPGGIRTKNYAEKLDEMDKKLGGRSSNSEKSKDRRYESFKSAGKSPAKSV